MADRTVCVVGLGGIGAGVATRLLAAGFPVVVFNRTAAKAEPLARAGATVAASAAEAGAAADVVVLSLSDEHAVDEVLFGEMTWRLRPGTVVVDMSTVSPSYARASAVRLAAGGLRRVEACVIGNPQMATAGELRVFTAGEPADVAAVDDVLAALSRQGGLHLGPAGRASTLKLAFNLLLGGQTAALAEAVAFAERFGVDRELLLTAVVKSGWRSPVLNFRAEFMRTRRYRPAGFRSRLMAKDLGLVLEEAAAAGLELPVTRRAADRFGAAVAAGLGDDDAAVVVDVPHSPVEAGR